MLAVARTRAHVLARTSVLASLRASSSRTILSPRTPSPSLDQRYLATRPLLSTTTGLLSRRTPFATPLRQSPFPRRLNSTTPPHSHPPRKEPCPHCSKPDPPALPPVPKPPPGYIQEYTPFIRRIITQSSVLHSHHRPTKEDLLKAADGWWQRLRIRLKWFTIRGWRRFNTDDLSAFLSWFVVGNTLWILIGTTTFVSAVFATLNSLSLQEYVARWISDYLTSSSGLNVIFESAIVPRWGSGKIAFRNVYVSRRPQDHTAEGKTKTATATATATAAAPSPVPFLSSSIPRATYLDLPRASEEDNYTMFDINFDEVEVTLSLKRWLDGKGLVKDAKVKGVRGVIDRRSVWWDTSQPMSPADFRHATQTGDFELDSFDVEDFLVTVYQPGGQRPFNVSIFNAKFAPFRKRWLFYDMISAEAMTGQYDNCLFSLHMPQKLGKSVRDSEHDFKRMARFRIDGLPIEHAQYASGHEGAMAWFTSGKLDAVLDIKFPAHPDDQVDIKAIFDEIGRNVATIATSGVHPDDTEGEHVMSSRLHDTLAASEASSSSALIPGQHRLDRSPLRAPSYPLEDRRQVTIDIDLRFRDLKAAVPVFTSDLSVTNNALIRPIVAFINANRTLVPIHCQVAADLPDFDGSWTLFETGLMTSISDQIYSALAHHVSSEAANTKRIKQVSFWGIQRGAEVLLDTLKTVVDPVYGQTLASV